MDTFAEALKGLVLQGAGIAWLPQSSVTATGADGDLSLLEDFDNWSAKLTLSVFAAPDRLDETVVEIWKTLSKIANSSRKKLALLDSGIR
jgi:DNA-binding transcriptional LysR family regulator